jgi:hypothetical protein
MHNLPRHAGVLMRLVMFVAGACLSAGAAAQAPPQGPVPLQKEGTTLKLSEHVYVIPDFKVGMVPNVGIVVGSRATLVVDPGMGLPNGKVVLREVQKVSQGPDLYIVNTHFEGVSHVLALSEGSSKLIPIHEEPNHQIVHLFRLGKANRTTHQPLDSGP